MNLDFATSRHNLFTSSHLDMFCNSETIVFCILITDQCHNLTDVQLHCELCKEAQFCSLLVQFYVSKNANPALFVPFVHADTTLVSHR